MLLLVYGSPCIFNKYEIIVNDYFVKIFAKNKVMSDFMEAL